MSGSRKASRSTTRQEAAAAVRRQAERDARRKKATIAASVVVAIAVVAGLVLIATGNRNDADVNAAPDIPSSVELPSGLTEGSLLTGKDDAKVTVTVYEDLQCPACKNFEATTGPTLTQLVEDGTVKVLRRPIAFLDRASTTDYSSRAMNAVGCVIDSRPTMAVPFIESLYDKQPAEGGAGLPDSQLVSLAKDSGADGIGDCVEGKDFASWVEASTDAATKAGVNSTPTVLVGGKVLQDRSPEGLQAAVEAAASA